jgi:hypothetical protein
MVDHALPKYQHNRGRFMRYRKVLMTAHAPSLLALSAPAMAAHISGASSLPPADTVTSDPAVSARQQPDRRHHAAKPRKATDSDSGKAKAAAAAGTAAAAKGNPTLIIQDVKTLPP